MSRFLAFFSLLFALLLVIPSTSQGFQSNGCGEGKCSDCHSLTVEEAKTILKDLVDEVKEVRNSEVPGLWEVDVLRKGIAYVAYIDYSKKYLFSGNILRIPDRKNITRERLIKVRKIKEVKISLENTLVIGNRNAPRRVLVFTDPRCPFCKKLHGELKKIVKENDSYAFFIILFPLKIHKDAYDVAKAIVCEKSMKLLEDSFEGKTIPKPTCETKVIDENIELAKKLGIRSTPTLILPDGRVVTGYRPAEELLRILEGKPPERKKPEVGKPAEPEREK